MKRIELNHWFINNNRLSIGLMRYHVSIERLESDCYIVEVIDSLRNVLTLSFISLEEAINFTESYINYAQSFEEINQFYLGNLEIIKKKRR